MSFNKSLLIAGSALVALMASNSAFAQSTATQDAEETTEVIVKSNRKGSGPLNKETGPKQKSVITQDFIASQAAGQTIAESLNIVPGVNFTSNDPYGSSGGDIFIRGLDNSRISLTFDGVQLNDAGNYAIYTNQQLDPELIQNASIITGATDVDSMSASATGGTLNYTTRKTSEEFGIDLVTSLGTDAYKRIFGIVNTGSFGPWGTQAWIAASSQSYDTFTNDRLINDEGKLDKQQYNFSIYQPVGADGSFMNLSGHFNRNRNHFIFGQSLANFAANGPYYNSINRANINPSNTGNLRFKSRWNLNEKTSLFADLQYQYVMANGGGNSTVNEVAGRIGNYVYANMVGVDQNGDGDALDTSVGIYRPNTTHTDRYGGQFGLRYDLSDNHTVRFGYSIDRARTRQTGEATLLNADGSPRNVFGAKEDRSLLLKINPNIVGGAFQRRNRFSLANVDVLNVEYRGRFMEEKLFVAAGLRQQKMERELNQYCYSRTTGTGSFDPFCTNQTPTTTNLDGTVTFTGNTGSYIKPYKRNVSFDKLAPSLGLTYEFNDNNQTFFNYSENMSSPRTDNYYAVVLVGGQVTVANPDPEETKGFELGHRYNNGSLNISGNVWTKDYSNRIVSSYDAVTDTFFDRNVGEVKMKGFEGSLAFKPVSSLDVFAGVTYTDTEVQSNLPNGEVTTALGSDTVGTVLFIPTAGKKLVEVPEWMYNLAFTYRPNDLVSVNLTGKYVGERFATDVNDMKTDDYTTWNLSVRYNLHKFGKNTQMQLNVINLFDEYYFGNISTANALNTINTPSGTRIVGGSNPSFNVGAPMTAMVSLKTSF